MVRELREQYMGKAWWPRVHWHGWVERVQEFLQSVDVLIVPSREFDPFPTVLLEAGQAGIPVLASRVGGVSEIVDDGKTGWLFEPGDWAGAASKLREHALKPDQRRSLGRQASARIADEFSVGKMVESYLKLYGEIST
jgi:glycosyltransferase involved in cell wall biosynthesis